MPKFAKVEKCLLKKVLSDLVSRLLVLFFFFFKFYETAQTDVLRIILPPNSILSKFLELDIQSTVMLRFRKSISGHHLQNTRNFANNDFQYHRDVIFNDFNV